LSKFEKFVIFPVPRSQKTPSKTAAYNFFRLALKMQKFENKNLRGSIAGRDLRGRRIRDESNSET
jgi:hypothetical protein